MDRLSRGTDRRYALSVLERRTAVGEEGSETDPARLRGRGRRPALLGRVHWGLWGALMRDPALESAVGGQCMSQSCKQVYSKQLVILYGFR